MGQYGSARAAAACRDKWSDLIFPVPVCSYRNEHRSLHDVSTMDDDVCPYPIDLYLGVPYEELLENNISGLEAGNCKE